MDREQLYNLIDDQEDLSDQEKRDEYFAALNEERIRDYENE